MSTIIKGQIKSVAVINTHTEPPLEMSAGEHLSNTVFTMQIGGFINTGNIPQTITIDSIDGFVNCSPENEGSFRADPGISSVGRTATIQPGKQAVYEIEIRVNEVPLGAPLEDFEFNADWTWS
jgi:hypothetical protein